MNPALPNKKIKTNYIRKRGSSLAKIKTMIGIKRKGRAG